MTASKKDRANAPVVQDGENPGAVNTPISLSGEGHVPEPGEPSSLKELAAMTQAKNRPVMAPTSTEVTESTAPERSAFIPSEGTLDRMNRSDLDLPVQNPAVFNEKAAALAFNEELLIIHIHETEEQGAEQAVPLYLNGVPCFIPRGSDQIVKRKYVELLMRAKPIHVRTTEFVREDGERAIRIGKKSTLRYPFSIVKDESPKSREWMKKILSEG